MTHLAAYRTWFAACTEANAMPPGPARDAAMIEVRRLSHEWRGHQPDTADKLAMLLTGGPLFPMQGAV